MIFSSARSLWTVLIAVVVIGSAASMVGCASADRITPVAVTDVQSVAGTWQGVVYEAGSEPEQVELTIHTDGSYEVVSRQAVGESRGKGKVVVSDGRLIFQGEKGNGIGRLLSGPGGERVLNIEATLSDNSTLSARLWPSR